MRKLSIIAWVGAALLAGCGGDSSSIVNEGKGGGTSATVAVLAVTTSSATVASDGSTSATITATATDASNAPVSGATVTFAASAGSLSATSATTNSSGVATAALTASSVAPGTNITVTSKSAAISGNSVVVAVFDPALTITLATNLPQIPSDGSKTATITAVVRNATNQFVTGTVVTFAATAGGGLTVTQGTTDASGTATASLTAVSDPSNPVVQKVTVTATTGKYSALPLPVTVTGTKLSVTGPPSLVIGGTGSYLASLVNSSGAGIANASVALTSSAGNTLSVKTGVTNTQGQVAFTVTAAKSGSDTITATISDATGNTLTGTQSISVSAQSFAFTTPAAGTITKVNLNIDQALTVALSNNLVGQPGQTVSFAATRGTLTAGSAVTDSSGHATVAISSTVAGPAVVTASVGSLTAQVNVDFVATTPAVVNLQASPATIATQGQSTLTAVVRDANDNLVEGQTVNFATVGDTTGGSLSVASAQTDSQGRAQTVYTASTTPSGTSGVNVTATVANTTITGSTNITVGGLTVFLSLGTGNQIAENATKTQFLIPYTVEALDAAGNPVAGVSITLKVFPLYYGKGEYTPNTKSWVQGNANTVDGSALFCPNEDSTSTYAPANFNGVLDPGEDGCHLNTNNVLVDNDTDLPVVNPYSCNAYGNGNGHLDPGGTAIAVPTVPGTQVTASDGSLNFNVVYPEDQATWVTVQLVATASVQGTSNSAISTFTLPILASYLTTLSSDPPGKISPYGVAGICTNPN